MRRTDSPLSVFWDGLFIHNPVAVEALGIFPIVAAAASLQTSVVLAVCMAVIMLPVCLAASLFGRRVSPWLRAALYVLFSAAMLIPANILVEKLLPKAYFSITFFIPLLAVNAIITVRAERFSIRNRLLPTLMDALGNILGFALIICLVGACREIMGSATLWGRPMPWVQHAGGMLMPFGGFIMLGFIAALFTFLASKRRNGEEGETKE